MLLEICFHAHPFSLLRVWGSSKEENATALALDSGTGYLGTHKKTESQNKDRFGQDSLLNEINITTGLLDCEKLHIDGLMARLGTRVECHRLNVALSKGVEPEQVVPIFMVWPEMVPCLPIWSQQSLGKQKILRKNVWMILLFAKAKYLEKTVKSKTDQIRMTWSSAEGMFAIKKAVHVASCLRMNPSGCSSSECTWIVHHPSQ